MWRDSDTIRWRFCPLHSLDGWRVATVIKRMAIRSPMAWREAPRHRENHRRQQFGVLCILWFGKTVAFIFFKNPDTYLLDIR